jgi:sterol desaturase/sphingolipid hydroxylase (fatty acid hydroxylase superfamily)
MALLDIVPNFYYYRLLVIVFIAVSIAAEVFWSKSTGRNTYNAKETASNISILIIGRLFGFVLSAYGIAILHLFHAYCPWEIPESPWSWGFAFFLVDFWYYWQHRLNHSIKYLWALHEVHHSSPWLNLTTSFRLHWLGPFITPFFFGPLALCGFTERQILFLIFINLFYQFFLHTEAIGKLGPLEGWINTPSAHRVHHGCNKAYRQRNFGGVLMIWDHIFGTYAAEVEVVKYGIAAGFLGHNPFVAQFRGLMRLFNSVRPNRSFMVSNSTQSISSEAMSKFYIGGHQ